MKKSSINGSEFISDLSQKSFSKSQKVVSNSISDSFLKFIQTNHPHFNENSCLSISELSALRVQFIASKLKGQLGELSSMEKLVYSRTKSEKLTIPSERLFERLAEAYPNAFVYYFKDQILGEWIGATPEILMKGSNQRFESMSLAGTKKADDKSPWGEKERKEQDFVSQFYEKP